MRCHFCGERVSRSDETCWNCGAILRYGEPGGTLQQEMESRYEPNEWVSRNMRTILAIGIILGIILAGLGGIYFYQEMNESPILGSMRITDYVYGEVDDDVWFAVYIKNEGFGYDSRTVIAKVITSSGTYTNSLEVGADAGAYTSAYILVELPPGENQGSYQTNCYLSLY